MVNLVIACNFVTKFIQNHDTLTEMLNSLGLPMHNTSITAKLAKMNLIQLHIHSTLCLVCTGTT